MTALLRKRPFTLQHWFVAILSILSVSAVASNCTSVASGYWHQAATWSCTGLPAAVGCGKTITVLSNHTVTVDNQHNYLGCTEPIHIIVYGTLQFTNGNKLDLPCGSVVEIMAGGIVKKATAGGGNSTLVGICSEDWWIAGDGPQSGYQIWGVLNPLPVELLSFSAVAVELDALVTWSTASEFNNDFFVLERSFDLKNWSLIATIIGHGNAISSNSYSYRDIAPATGIVYYRLYQQDFNGIGKYIAQSAVNLAQNNWIVFPNPGNGEWNLHSNQNLENVNFQVFDLLGRPVNTDIYVSGNSAQIVLSTYYSGTFFIKVSSSEGGILYQQKLVSR
jgi:hypothetical protein